MMLFDRTLWLHSKVVIKILQCSVITVSIYPPVANFLLCICAKNYESWLAVDKVIAVIT